MFFWKTTTHSACVAVSILRRNAMQQQVTVVKVLLTNEMKRQMRSEGLEPAAAPY